jgi:hypothetical protein
MSEQSLVLGSGYASILLTRSASKGIVVGVMDSPAGVVTIWQWDNPITIPLVWPLPGHASAGEPQCGLQCRRQPDMFVCIPPESGTSTSFRILLTENSSRIPLPSFNYLSFRAIPPPIVGSQSIPICKSRMLGKTFRIP